MTFHPQNYNDDDGDDDDDDDSRLALEPDLLAPARCSSNIHPTSNPHPSEKASNVRSTCRDFFKHSLTIGRDETCQPPCLGNAQSSIKTFSRSQKMACESSGK